MEFSEQEEHALSASDESESVGPDSAEVESELTPTDFDSNSEDEAALESEVSPAESELPEADLDSVSEDAEEVDLEAPSEDDLEDTEPEEAAMETDSSEEQLDEVEDLAEITPPDAEVESTDEQIEEPMVDETVADDETAEDQEQVEPEVLDESDTLEEEKSDSELETAVEEAFSQCLDMRIREGEALTVDLDERLRLFTEVLDSIDQNIPLILADRERALRERLEKLLDTIDLDPARLAQEVAILVDKSDVTEEMVRLRSHIAQLGDLLESPEPVGRKLDFLIQEFLREVNSIASKISNADTAHLTVDMKNDLEKIREQVQNLE